MTTYGLDFSHYDAVPDGARVVGEGFSFMTHKAGGDKDDAELAAWWKAMKPYRGSVLLGAYWVLYPGNPTGRAQAFLARLDSQCPGWRDGPFILQLDCEIWNGDQSTKPGLGDIRTACAYLKAKMPKLRPIVYASAGQYGNSLSGLGYPLWNARYPSNTVAAASAVYDHASGDGGPGWGSYSGQTPAIWQFTSSATALGQTTCDANAYRGTLAELTSLVAPGWEDDLVTPAEFVSLLKDPDVAKALCAAVFNTDNVVAAPAGAGADSVKANPYWAPGTILQNTYNNATSGRDWAAKAAGQTFDPEEFAAAVVAKLPTVGDPVTQDEVTTAVKAAFADAFGDPTQHPAA